MNVIKKIKTYTVNKTTVVSAFSSLLVLTFLLPVVIVRSHTSASTFAVDPSPAPMPIQTEPSRSSFMSKELYVSVYLTKERRVIEVPLEQYVLGVVVGEIPPQFELEACKAQAIAARTFIARRLFQKDRSGVPDKAADVTDCLLHQVYKNPEQVKQQWDGQGKLANWQKLQQAVSETNGKIVTYEGKPIQAVFFSTSNGYTENAEEVWGAAFPYLKSVTSPWDEREAPGYKKEVTLPVAQMRQKLGLSHQSKEEDGSNVSPSIQVLSRTTGNRIKQIQIEGKTFTGREVRERLALRSSQFTFQANGEDICFTTYGYGHGVGMSQWGANGMAKEGATAERILKYYYKNTDLQTIAEVMPL